MSISINILYDLFRKKYFEKNEYKHLVQVPFVSSTMLNINLFHTTRNLRISFRVEILKTLELGTQEKIFVFLN